MFKFYTDLFTRIYRKGVFNPNPHQIMLELSRVNDAGELNHVGVNEMKSRVIKEFINRDAYPSLAVNLATASLGEFEQRPSIPSVFSGASLYTNDGRTQRFSKGRVGN